MQIGAITKATLMLTTRFNQSTTGPRPLSPSEYHNLAQWLETRAANLADLLKPNARILLRPYVGADRLLALLRDENVSLFFVRLPAEFGVTAAPRR